MELRKNLWFNVKKLNREGVTIILTTHYLFEAPEMCDRIAIINKGKLVALDTTQKLLERISRKIITLKIVESNSDFRPELKGVKFERIEKDKLVASFEKKSNKFDELINYLKANNVKIVDIFTDDGDLEEVFVNLTKS